LKKAKGILPIFIALIVVGSLGLAGGGFAGFQYSQSVKYHKAADLSFINGNYGEAASLYERSLSHWKKKEVLNKKNNAEKEKVFSTILDDGKRLTGENNWQGCIDKLGGITPDSKSFSPAQGMILGCQVKAGEEAAAKKKAEEEAAAAEAAKEKAAQSSSKKTVASSASTQTTPKASSTPAVVDPTKCTSNANPVFTNQLIDPSYITNILPPPNVAQPSGHLKTHSYIDVFSSRVPLYAPVDMVLIKGDYYTGGPYYFDFRITCEVTLRVAHVTEPIDKIKDAFGADPNAAGEIEISPPIILKAGELFAYSGGPPYVLNNGLDFGVYNSTKPNRYVGSQTSSIYTTAVCPYDYFSSSFQATYKAKFNLLQHQGMTKDGDSFCQ